MMTTKLKNTVRAALLLGLMVITPAAPAVEVGSDINVDMKREYGAGKVRVIVFDFTTDSEWEKPMQLSRSIRAELAGSGNFAVLSIDEINRLIITGNFAKRDLGGKRKSAAYAGSKLRADKVVTGSVTGEGNMLVVYAEVTDVATGKVEFSKRYIEDALPIEKESILIARDIGHTLTGMPGPSPAWEEKDAPETRLTASGRLFSLSLGTAVSFGMLSARGLPGEYLKSAYLTALHAEIRYSPISWMHLDLSAGYARFNARNIENGNADLLLVPALIEARFPLRVSRRQWIPDPVFSAGGGVSFLSLNKTQNGVSTTATGYDTTFSGGIGLSWLLQRGTFIDLEGRYMYLFENIPVSYMYGGIRAGIVF